MVLTKEECENDSLVLEEAKIALQSLDAVKLRELSDRTINSSCSFQDPGSITTAVLVYTLSKLVERSDYKKIKSWPIFLKKFNAIIDLAILALSKNNHAAYEKYIKKARELLESSSINLHPYIEEVLKKASINKASKIYEQGISKEKTASLLGITQWELSEYIGQKVQDSPYSITINTKTRAKMALEFFS